MCTSRAPAPRIISTILRDVVPRTIESSTTTTRLPFSTSRTGRQLQLHAEVADLLRRLDEGAPHVVRAHQPLVVGDAALARVADGGGDARVGHRDDDVGRRPRARRPAGAPSARARGRPTCRRWSSPAARSRPTRTRSGARGCAPNGRTLRSAALVDDRPSRPARRRARTRRPSSSNAQVSDETTQVRPWPCPAPAGGSPSDRARRSAMSSVRKTSE